MSRKAHKAHYERLKEWIRGIKSIPCMDCQNIYPSCCMDFDHVRGKKEFNIGQNTNKVSKSRMLAEIKKCDIVCSNCHRIRTELRRTKKEPK